MDKEKGDVFMQWSIIQHPQKKKILTHTTVWMNLEDIMPSEISQSQKDKYSVIPHIRGTSSSQVQGDRK